MGIKYKAEFVTWASAIAKDPDILYRQTDTGCEVYGWKTGTWEISPEACAAFYDSPDAKDISEEDARRAIEEYMKSHVNK